MSYFKAKMHQIDFGWGSAPDPAGGAHIAPPDPLAGFKGARALLRSETVAKGEGQNAKEKGREGKGREERERKGGERGIAPWS